MNDLSAYVSKYELKSYGIGWYQTHAYTNRIEFNRQIYFNNLDYVKNILDDSYFSDELSYILPCIHNCKSVEMLDYLLLKGADINTKDPWGRTLLDNQVRLYGKKDEFAQYIKKRGGKRTRRTRSFFKK